MSFLLYGAYGYTGDLIARRAVEEGLCPTLAGRDPERLAALGNELDLTHEAFSLDDRAALDRALADVPVVLHAAGPFSRTARPMAEACIRTGTHYLDITGEIPVYEMLAAMGGAAQRAGVMLLPGVGFDVVPTDCLALHLKDRLPSATHLELAFLGLGGISRGTATTMIENLGKGGAARRDGRIVRVPPAWKTRTVDFGRGPKEVVSIPWGDIATAYRSTNIPNITTYTYVGSTQLTLMRLSRYLGPVLAWPPVQAALKWLIRQQPPGPSAEQRRRGRSLVWGMARDDAGQEVTSRLEGPEGYRMTSMAALQAVKHVLDGRVTPGFQTPATAFGKDFVLELEGVTREDVTR